MDEPASRPEATNPQAQRVRAAWAPSAARRPLNDGHRIALAHGAPQLDPRRSELSPRGFPAGPLVALDARTGERRWHFQGVHHGLWDYDFPAAPNLVDIEVDGKKIAAVAQVSKQAFTYVFNRETGEPVWPIEEREVPASTVPGERAAKTQPFPTKPPPFDRIGFGEDDVIDLTPQMKKTAMKTLEDFLMADIFTPPILPGENGKKATITMPGLAGGANWGGASVDPETGFLYVPSQTSLYTVAVAAAGERVKTDMRYTRQHPQVPGPEGLPIVKPPWTRLTAIDLNKGEIAWQVPHGAGPKDHPALAGLELPDLGSWPMSGLAPGWSMVTETLLVTAQGVRLLDQAGSLVGYLRAYDKGTGEMIFEHTIDQAVRGAPMTYVTGGKQYIVVPVGDGRDVRQLRAFTLP